MKRSRPKDTQVRGVEHVLGNDQATTSDEDSMQLGEERSLILTGANLMDREGQEDRVERGSADGERRCV